MRSDLNLVLALGVLMAVQACGSIPQPFRPPEFSKQHNEFLLAPNSAGVVVRRIDGPVGWVGDALAQAMATALRDQGIVAGSRWSNQHSLRLSASGYQKLHLDRPPELVMTWSLADGQGNVKQRRETRTVPIDAFWETPTPDMFRAIAERNAEMVVSWIDPTRNERAPRLVVLPSLSVAAIEEAPGDGATSLHGTILLALRAERIPVSSDGDGELRVKPRIEVVPADTNTERVSITWILSVAADGAELGRVAQENTIPTGRLNGRWGAVAVAIADGAADGIAGLVRAYRDAKVAGGLMNTQ
jgi:hypothetical protein